MAEPHTVDEERAYIENLLNTRFNYYLLFVSVLLVPIASENPLSYLARVCLLAFGACVSALMAYMVVRTKLLLDELLKTIADDHPYKLACAEVEKNGSRFKRNANDLMVLLVLLITLFFFAGVALAVASPDALFNQRSGPVQRQP